MKKIILFSIFFVLGCSLYAQSINNKNWKSAFGEPFNDTLTFHIRGDSSFVTMSSGEVLVRIDALYPAIRSPYRITAQDSIPARI